MVRKLANGAVAIYWYKRRGGPLLARYGGPSLEAAERLEARSKPTLVAAYNEPVDRLPSDPKTVRDLVVRYKAAPDGFRKLAASTIKRWGPWLDRIIDDFGDMPLAALGARGAKRVFIDWRNGFSDKPRTADYAVQVVRRVFSWGLDNELIEANPALGIRDIYAANRADVVVTEAELKAIVRHTSPHARLAFRVAAATGLRRGDLVGLKWGEVGRFSIERATEKSRNERRIIVPLTTDARILIKVLQRLRSRAKTPSLHVLNSRQGPWTADGLTATWVKAVRAAKEAGDIAPGRNLHLHDLRGTAVTRFCLAKLTDEEIADVMGWEPKRVRSIRKRYVDRENIARGIVARLERERRAG